VIDPVEVESYGSGKKVENKKTINKSTEKVEQDTTKIDVAPVKNVKVSTPKTADIKKPNNETQSNKETVSTQDFYDAVHSSKSLSGYSIFIDGELVDATLGKVNKKSFKLSTNKE